MTHTKLVALLVVAAVAAVCVPADALSVNVLKGEVHHDDGRLTEGGADKKSSLDVTPLLAGMFGGDVGGMAMASAQQASALKASGDAAAGDDDDDDDAVPEEVDEATGTVLSLEERAAKEQAEDAAADMADVMGEDVTAADDPDHRMEARASAACEKHKAAAEAAAPAQHAAGGPATNETHVLVMEDEASAALAASAAAPAATAAGGGAAAGGSKEPPLIDTSKVAHHFEKAVEREEREQGAAPMPVTEPKTLDDELLRGVVHGVGDNAPPDTAPVLDASTVRKNKNAEPPAAPTRMPKEGVKSGPDESAEELKRRDAKDAQEQHKKAETFHVAGNVVEESHRNLKNAAANLGANE